MPGGKTSFGVVCAQRAGLAVVGCTAEIVRILEKYPDGRMDILCQGAKRFEIENLDNTRSFLQAEVDFFGDEGLPATRAMREECTALHFEVQELMGGEKSHRAFDLNGTDCFSSGVGVTHRSELPYRIVGIAVGRSAHRTVDRVLQRNAAQAATGSAGQHCGSP